MERETNCLCSASNAQTLIYTKLFSLGLFFRAVKVRIAAFILVTVTFDPCVCILFDPGHCNI